MDNNKNTGQYITGGNRRSTEERQEDDFYITPPAAIDDLLKLWQIPVGKKIWENAVGNGSLFYKLKDLGFNVTGSDKNTWKQGFFVNNFLQNPNWFENQFGSKPDIILTNPPYGRKILNEWITKSLEQTRRWLVLFCKLTLLESIERAKIFKSQMNLKHVFVYGPRINPIRWSYVKEGIKLKSSGTAAYAWYVWDKTYQGLPTIDWIVSING